MNQMEAAALAVNDDGCDGGGKLARLHEELQLEITPQTLLRQYTVSVPPCSVVNAEGDAGAFVTRAGLLDASPSVLEDVLRRWEKNQVKWRQFGAEDVMTQDETESEKLPNVVGASAAAAALTLGENLFADVPADIPSARRVPDTFEVKFGDGFLGLEFVLDEAKGKVVVKNVHTDAWSANVLQIPPGMTITPGLVVVAVNGQDVNAMAPEDIMDSLTFSKRPMIVRFQRASRSEVVCKLCETKVDTSRLDEHTNYCVLSKRVELEADVINSSLMKLTSSITASLEMEAMRPHLNQEETHIFHTLRVAAIQASACDVSSVESFALCSRLVKILDRIRQQETEDGVNFAVERGVKYCSKLRNLIHAKMSKMRASHKAMLQQSLTDAVPHVAFKRTKSLEEMDSSSPRPPVRRTKADKPRASSYRVSIRDFQITKPISKGAFGKVYLAKKKTTGDQYAIKVLAKEHLLRKKQIQQIETERNILASVVSPFVVKLFWTFQTKRNLFLVMEYLPGGDFMSLLECIVQLEEQVACVYIAEVAIALHHLHSKGCVHRDLKPDNILLSSSGHIKLTDFGLSEEAVTASDTDSENEDEAMGWTALATGEDSDLSMAQSIGTSGRRSGVEAAEMPTRTKKKSAYHTYGRCGTPDYLAPEIILGVPHGPPVDYWALGVILYEMLVGFPPFNDDTVDAIFGNILERQILWPDGDKCLSPEARDLIDKLLDPDPTTRMGWEGMTTHPFFEGINWDTLLESVPPFVPTLEGPNDTSYFNNRNLTDIFIDDDEFDVESQSASSNSSFQNVDVGPEMDETDKANGLNLQATGGVSAETTDGDISWGPEGALDASAASLEQQPNDELHETTAQPGLSEEQHDELGERSLSACFPKIDFEITNFKALAASSQEQAGLLAGMEQQEVESLSGPSILI